MKNLKQDLRLSPIALFPLSSTSRSVPRHPLRFHPKPRWHGTLAAHDERVCSLEDRRPCVPDHGWGAPPPLLLARGGVAGPAHDRCHIIRTSTRSLHGRKRMLATI